MTESLTQQLRRIERIDQLIASADACRNKTLTENARRREAVARRLRTMSADLRDVA
jgi:hypothetical protein